MFRLVILIISICIMAPAISQDLTGIWRGYFIPNSDINGRLFPYEIEIKENAAHQIEAITLTQLPNNVTAKAVASGIHSTATNLVSVKEDHFDNLKLGSNLQACLMTNYLEYSSFRENEMLQGTYISINEKKGTDCGGGKVYLEKIKPLQEWVASKKIADKKKEASKLENKLSGKADTKFEKKLATAKVNTDKLSVKNDSLKKNKKTANETLAATTSATEKKPDLLVSETTKLPEERKIVAEEEVEKIKKNKLKVLPWVLVGRENKLVKTISTSNNIISIDLYDNGTIDNDTIMIFDNNELIVDKKRLSYKAIHVEFEFSELNKEHEVIIVAHNMGSVPPNTALLVLKDGNKRQEYFITSTDKMNAKIVFEYIPPTTPVKPGQQ